MSTPLIDAINRRSRRQVSTLLRDGADPNKKAPGDFWLPLSCAVRKGNVEVLELLLAAGADVRKDPDALCHAVDLGRAEIIRRLLAAGANPDEPRRHPRESPLCYANDLATVELLLAAGADVRRDPGPLCTAAKLGRADIVRRLLAAGADPDAPYRCASHAKAERPLACATDVNVLELLLAAGADVRKAPAALGLAARHGQVEIVKRLLAAGANPNATLRLPGAGIGKHKSRTVLELARACYRKEQAAQIMVLLIEAGAKVANPKRRLAELRRHGIQGAHEKRLQEVHFSPTPPSRPWNLRDGQAEFYLTSAGYTYCLYDRHVLNRPVGELGDMGFGSPARVRSCLGRLAYMQLEVYSKVILSRFRVVTRELTDQEADEWVGRVVWRLDLASGLLGLCGGHICDAENADGEEFQPVYVRVPAARYRVEVYNYWPEAAAFQMGGELDHLVPDDDLEAYWRRTRPGQPLPPWIRSERHPRYVDFLVRLAPLVEEPTMPQVSHGQFVWECRVPQRCPLGVLAGGVSTQAGLRKDG